MARSTPSKKSLPAIIGGLVLVAGASYLGIDLSQDSEQARPSQSADSNNGTNGTAGKESVAAEQDTCNLASLPDQADIVVSTILDGGPYDYPDNDNKRFGNYEGELPQEKKDYYREYTVETPGLGHRGARRIVTGGGTETDPEVWYYTDDHYESFCEIPDAEMAG